MAAAATPTRGEKASAPTRPTAGTSSDASATWIHFAASRLPVSASGTARK